MEALLAAGPADEGWPPLTWYILGGIGAVTLAVIAIRMARGNRDVEGAEKPVGVIGIILVGIAILTVVTSGTSAAPDIEFSEAGSRCGPDAIWLDSATGDYLPCTSYGDEPTSPAAGYGQYLSADEVNQIVALAQRLADGSGGLTDADRDRVQELTDELYNNSVENSRF